MKNLNENLSKDDLFIVVPHTSAVEDVLLDDKYSVVPVDSNFGFILNTKDVATLISDCSDDIDVYEYPSNFDEESAEELTTAGLDKIEDIYSVFEADDMDYDGNTKEYSFDDSDDGVLFADFMKKDSKKDEIFESTYKKGRHLKEVQVVADDEYALIMKDKFGKYDIFNPSTDIFKKAELRKAQAQLLVYKSKFSSKEPKLVLGKDLKKYGWAV